MFWKKWSYELKGAVAVTLINVVFWLIYLICMKYNCRGDAECGIGVLVMVVIAIASIIPAWFLGLLIGWVIKKSK